MQHQFGSAFSGCLSMKIYACVTSFHWFSGIWLYGMNTIVSVPSTMPSRPWTRWWISLPNALDHFGIFMSCLYSNMSPVSLFITTLANLHNNCSGYFRDARFCWLSEHVVNSHTESMTSDMMLPCNHLLRLGVNLYFPPESLGVELSLSSYCVVYMGLFTHDAACGVAITLRDCTIHPMLLVPSVMLHYCYFKLVWFVVCLLLCHWFVWLLAEKWLPVAQDLPWLQW